MTKVYVERQDGLLRAMFLEEGFELTNSVFEADLLCLDGGADITPSLYGEENTHSYNDPTRDLVSLGLYGVAKLRGIPIVGICRGSQLLNVINGGTMIQDVSGHAGAHHFITYQGKVYEVNSTHHQASVPCSEGVVHPEDIYRAPDGVVEAMISRVERTLSFQPHPEYVGRGDSCRLLFFAMLDEIM